MKRYFNLENLIIATILLLPIYLVRFTFFGISTNVLEVLIILSLFLWTLRKDKIISPVIKENKAIFISAGIIFLGLLISTLMNQNYKIGFGIIKGWFVLPLLFAFIVQNVFRGKKKETVFVTYFYSTLAVALISLVYYFAGKITYDARLEAFFNSPNYLMMYLAPGLIFGVFKLIDSKNISSSRGSPVIGTTVAIPVSDALKFGIPRYARNDRYFYILFLAIVISASYLTKSYAGWLSVFIAILITSLIVYKKKARLYLFAGALFILVIVFFQLRTTKFVDLISLNQRSSLSSRIMIWAAAEKIIADNWLLGIGPGNFQNKYLEYQKYFPPYLEWAVPHPHNLYLSFWLSGGLLGILVFLSLIIFWIKKIWQRADKIEYIGILAIFLYILIHGFFDTTYFKNDLSVVFWLVIMMGL